VIGAQDSHTFCRSRNLGPRHRLAAWLLAVTLLGALEACRPARPRAVILIVVDTLRADHLGVYGYARPASPNVDAWARQAAIFEWAVSPSSWTLPTFGSILTGQIPSRHSVGSRVSELDRKRTRRLDDNLPTLPEALRDQGFATAAIVNNPWLKHRFGMSRGFDSYDYRLTNNQKGRRANEVLDLALAWIEEHEAEPFLVLVHLFDPHLTYEAPAPVRGRFTKEFERFALPVNQPKDIRSRIDSISAGQRSFITAAYDEEIAFVDQELGRFFETLRSKGLWKRLLVVLTSDHGEEFFEHGGFEHGHSLYQEVVRVPLLFWGPAVRAGREPAPATLVDLTPTILDAVGVAGSETYAGVSLWPTLTRRRRPAPRSLVSEGTLYGGERSSIIRWPLKLSTLGGNRELRLYDLASDPFEHTDLAALRPEEAARLRGELEATIRQARAQASGEELTLEDKTVEELRALGYLE
jgi:arylsulfatase A-like enzyme